ncbi:beta-galactosidase trimerization domain-containing protein [Pontiellaceae bacterium B12227]|nr:beta-galactosidase trimerization domain-containing protein [Pontiellaceae bacterium B12227]
MTHKLRFRQIHLDFHTSPAIPDIGVGFDKQQWQDTLKKGHVDSITTFASCHHGWSYYDTKVGKRHPNLDFDLLRAQFDASKEIDVNVPIYLTAGVHSRLAEEHPEWREVSAEGSFSGWTQSPLQAGFKTMCFNTPYLDHLCEQIREVVALFPNCDGIFLDIIDQGPCCCQSCMESMQRKGFDPLSDEDRKAHAKQVLENYYIQTTKAATDENPDMPIFHNSGHINRGDKNILKYFSHLELESLPTGGWGYDHFPMSAKYCKKIDKDLLGMTGKFHTTWGEFGGYKHPNALRYECAAMLAFGSKCSVGDQLHPSGSLDESTYAIIGASYKEVEEKEPWCTDTVNVADIAVLSSDAVNQCRDSAADIGACRLLLESHYLFDLIDADMAFDGYKLLILPDDIRVSVDLKNKLDAFLDQGGKLMLTGESGLNEEGTGFLFDIGAKFAGKNEFEPDYLMAMDELKPDITQSPLVMYAASQRITAETGRSLGKVCNSYFNRTYQHFSSHQHTPNNPDDCSYDCGTLNGNILYLAHPIFTIYRGLGAVAYKQVVVKAIDRILGRDKSLVTNLPSTARVSLMHQEKENRSILHLLYANTINRGGAMQLSGGNLESQAGSVEVIEELLSLHNVEVTLKSAVPVTKVMLEPQGKKLAFIQTGDEITLKIGEFSCHQMVVLEH